MTEQQIAIGKKSVEDAAKQSIQSRATDDANVSLGGVGSIGGGMFQYLFRAGTMVSPWWSTQRDIDLRRFVKKSDHLNGSMALLTSKVVNIPVRVEPRDMSLKSHIKQADEYNMRLWEESEFGQGWITAGSKWLDDYWNTDNGGYFEIMGKGEKDGPIVGPALGLASLDSTRIIRKKDIEFPLAYIDEDGRQYKLHRSRVAYASDQPSPILEYRGIGFCAVSRAINVAQNLVDISVYKQEKLGSRQPRGLLFTPGVPTNLVQSTLKMASEMMDNQSLRRFAQIPILGGNDTNARFELVDFVSLPDGFDEETSTRLGMFAIALAFGVPIRWIWPAATSGATKADAMYQHIAGLGGGIGRVLKTLSLILGGDPRGPRHSVGKFLPPHLKLIFDFQDDEQDRMKADIQKSRMETWATGLEIGATTLRVTREQMLEAGDITQAQFNQMELADGRLPSGEDILTLFYMTENELLDLGVDDPLDVERNDGVQMVKAIEDKMAEVRKAMPSVGSAKQKEAHKQALAALGKLREAYEKVHSAQQQATDAETDEQAQGEDQPGQAVDEENQRVEEKPPREEVIVEEDEEVKGLLAQLYSGVKEAVQDVIKARSKVWPSEDESEKGGPGSGHHGHAGVPGKRGGSAPGGGNIASLRGRVPLSGAIFDEMTNAEMDRTGVAGQGRVLGMIGNAAGDADWKNASRDKRENVKDQVATTLTNRIAGKPEDVTIPDDPTVESPWNETYDNVNDFVGQWARSSNDSDMRSLAIQRDAAAEFDLPLSEFTKSRIENMQQRAESERQMLGAGAKISSTLEPLLPSEKQQAILREMYNETQEQLQARGLKPGSYVTLYRGVQLPVGQTGNWKVGDNLNIEGNAVESWSVGRDIGIAFALGAPEGMRGVTFKMSVPIEMILSTCTTGFGCLTEAEVTILGSDGEAQVEWMSQSGES